MEWLLVAGVAVLVVWVARSAFQGVHPSESAQPSVQSGDVPKLTASERMSVAQEIVGAVEDGGSQWVEGVAIAKSYGLSIFDVHDEYMALMDAAEVEREVVTEVVPVRADRIVDLSHLDSTRMRVRGTFNYVPDSDRGTAGGSEYILFREPANAYDSMAVAVLTTDGLKVGYVSASRAAMLAPLLDELGAEGYRVSGVGASEVGVKLWVDLPKLPALRKFVTGAGAS